MVFKLLFCRRSGSELKMAHLSYNSSSEERVCRNAKIMNDHYNSMHWMFGRFQQLHVKGKEWRFYSP
ncbi:hypothetical protein SUGI_0755080 [Cryptomeria japonica]|nr:hypothetical protein SUGI_0755080 [Cryptomeria japonica]